MPTKETLTAEQIHNMEPSTNRVNEQLKQFGITGGYCDAFRKGVMFAKGFLYEDLSRIEELESEIDVLKTQYAILNSDTNKHFPIKIKSLESQLSTLTDQYITLQNSAVDIQDKLDALQGKGDRLILGVQLALNKEDSNYKDEPYERICDLREDLNEALSDYRKEAKDGN